MQKVLKTLSLALAAGALLSACQMHSQSADGDTAPRLELVKRFDHQVTGVTVTDEGRKFVSFPRWSEDAPVSVAELHKDGSVTPYPDEEWNAYRKNSHLSPRTHFVCVQSVVADGDGNLWVLDPAAPNLGALVPHGPKLVKIDLASNQVVNVIAFDAKAAPKQSYFNDVRFNPDGKHAYITDSGKGAIVVVDLETGKARRTLDGSMFTRSEAGVVPMADGRPLLKNGKPLDVQSDGIALSARGKYLYWQALTGKTIYRVPTAALDDPKVSSRQLAGKVEKLGESNVADGLWIDEHNVMFVTDPENNGVKIRTADGSFRTLVQDARLRWPDTFSEGPDGTIYVTGSHLQDSQWFHPEQSQRFRLSCGKSKCPRGNKQKVEFTRLV